MEVRRAKGLNLAFVEKPFALLSRNIVNVAGFDSQPGVNVGGDVLAKRLAVFRHAGGELQDRHLGLSMRY